LNPIQNEGLRLCLGAYKTSPAESLEVEAGVLPLHIRREQLALQYVLKLKSNPSNPAYNCIFPSPAQQFENAKLQEKFNTHPSYIPTLNIRLQEAIDQVQIRFEDIAIAKLPDTPPWLFEPIFVFWNLAENLKDETCPSVFITEFYNIRSTIFPEHKFIYTDGSKQDSKASSAAISNQFYKKERLLNDASIFSAELNAFNLAFDIIETHYKSSGKFVICLDSQSALQALEGDDFHNPFLLQVRERIHFLTNNCPIQLSNLRHFCNQKLPHSDFKPLIKPYIRNKWQTLWDEQEENNQKLKELQPSVDTWKFSSRKSRREEIILARLRIGHTHFTHSYLRKGEPPPQCITCGCTFTVKHILLECMDYSDFRNNYFSETNMKDLFEKTSPNNIIDFIKETELYNML
jgi:hypothetical protein